MVTTPFTDKLIERLQVCDAGKMRGCIAIRPPPRPLPKTCWPPRANESIHGSSKTRCDADASQLTDPNFQVVVSPDTTKQVDRALLLSDPNTRPFISQHSPQPTKKNPDTV